MVVHRCLGLERSFSGGGGDGTGYGCVGAGTGSFSAVRGGAEGEWRPDGSQTRLPRWRAGGCAAGAHLGGGRRRDSASPRRQRGVTPREGRTPSPARAIRPSPFSSSSAVERRRYFLAQAGMVTTPSPLPSFSALFVTGPARGATPRRWKRCLHMLL